MIPTTAGMKPGPGSRRVPTSICQTKYRYPTQKSVISSEKTLSAFRIPLPLSAGSGHGRRHPDRRRHAAAVGVPDNFDPEPDCAFIHESFHKGKHHVVYRKELLQNDTSLYSSFYGGMPGDVAEGTKESGDESAHS